MPLNAHIKLVTVLMWAGLLAATALGATIDKTNNAANLNLASSWVGGGVPGSGDVAQWSGVVTSANAVGLGANLIWAGIKLTSPGGAVTINSGNTLTLGTNGVDLSAATQDLAVNCALSLATNQTWNVATNRSLTISGNGTVSSHFLRLGDTSASGTFELQRDYYHHPGKKSGYCPADAALGLEGSYTPGLARLICLEGADESTYLKAERHLKQTGGIPVSARQIQRAVQRVGRAAQPWQQRPAQPGDCDAPILYVSADGTGVPMVPEELAGRRGKQADGTAKPCQVYLGGVFTQHKTDAEGRPVRDWDSTTYVSSFQPIDEFGPCLRQEAIRRGMGAAGQVVLLIDGAAGLENMGRLNFKDCLEIVDFFHAMEHAGHVLAALIGKPHPDYKKRRRRAKRLLKNKVQTLIQEARQQSTGQRRPWPWKKPWATLCATSAACSMALSARRATSSAPAWWRPAAKRSLADGAKKSGMFWSKPGAENILALRCLHSSRRLGKF